MEVRHAPPEAAGTKAPEKSGQMTFGSIDDACTFVTYLLLWGKDGHIFGGGRAWRVVW